MKLLGDYHTHTTLSDGHSLLEDNVKSAVNKGILQLAITDHSFSHMAHGITREKFEEQKRIKHEKKNAMYKLDEISSELNSALINEEGKNV